MTAKANYMKEKLTVYKTGWCMWKRPQHSYWLTAIDILSYTSIVYL